MKFSVTVLLSRIHSKTQTSIKSTGAFGLDGSYPRVDFSQLFTTSKVKPVSGSTVNSQNFRPP